MKDFKDVEGAEILRYLRPLADKPFLCPLVWLIIHALRHGLVDATTLADLLAQAAAHRKRRVVWLHPEYPVIPGIKRGEGTLVDPSFRAKVVSINSTLQQMGDIAGVLTPLTSHDLRRSSARDMAQIPAATLQISSSSDIIRQALTHSIRTMNNGITEEYIGGTSAEIWNLRAEYAPRIDRRAPQFGENATGQTLGTACNRITTKEVEHRRKEHPVEGLDMPGRNVRYRIRRERETKFLDEARLVEPRTAPVEDCNNYETSNSIPCESIDALREIVDGWAVNDANTPFATNNVTATSNAESDALDAAWMQDEATELFALPGEVKTGITPEDHIGFHSWCNAVRNEEFAVAWLAYHASEKTAQDVASIDEVASKAVQCGNSRNTPLPFQLECTKTTGCPYTTLRSSCLAGHIEVCNEALVTDQLNRKASKLSIRAFPCPELDCPKSYDSVDALGAHVRDAHSWKPQHCPRDCNPADTFDSRWLMQRHLHIAHSEDPERTDKCPTPCLYPDCDSSGSGTQFVSTWHYHKHLRESHHLNSDAEQAPYLPVVHWWRFVPG